MRIFSLSLVVLLCAFFNLTGMQLGNFADDPGVGWHLMTGKWIVEHASIPMVDPFLHSSVERSWVSDQWLSDLLIYSVFKLDSWRGLYFAMSVFYYSIFFIVLLPAVRRINGLSLASVISVFLAFKMGLIHFILRPVMFGFLFFAVLFSFLLRDYRTGGASHGVLVSRWRWGLVVMFVVWANMHPSFILGGVLLGVLVVSLIVDYWLAPSALGLQNIRRAIILSSCCGLATLVNPYSWHLHASLFSLVGSKYFMNLHSEWLGPDFKEFSGVLLEFAAATVFLAFLCQGSSNRKWKSFDILSFIVFLHLNLQAVRILPFFGIVASVVLAEAFYTIFNCSLLKRLTTWQFLQTAFFNLEKRESAFPVRSFGLVVMLGSAIYFGMSGSLPFYSGGLGPSKDKFPYGAMQKIDELIPNVLNVPIVLVAGPHLGGFITMQGFPRIVPVIDDRNTLLGEVFYRKFFKELSPTGDWRGLLAKLGANLLLLDASSCMAAFLEQGQLLPVLYKDSQSVVFEIVR